MEHSGDNGSEFTTPTKVPAVAQEVGISPQKSPQGSGSAGRRKKPRFFHQRDSIEKRMKPGRPGTPRYQRYLNQCFLKELQKEIVVDDEFDDWDELTDIMDKDKFVDFEGGFFAVLHNDKEAAKLWAPFLNVTLEENQELMSNLSSSYSREEIPIKHKIPQRYWEPLQKCTKNAHYWTFICGVEVHIMHFLELIASTPRDVASMAEMVSTVSFVEQGCENPFELCLTRDGDKNFPSFTLVLPSSYHRLLCHGLCSYYNLLSESRDEPCGRVTHVRIGRCMEKCGSDWYPSIPELSLASYILQYN